jgi:hypothetical protein
VADQLKFGIEEEPERVTLEVGVGGYIGTYLFRLLISIYSLYVFFRLKNFRFKAIALCCFLFSLEYVQLTQLVFNATASFYYYLCFGLLIAIQQIDRKLGRG